MVDLERSVDDGWVDQEQSDAVNTGYEEQRGVTVDGQVKGQVLEDGF